MICQSRSAPPHCQCERDCSGPGRVYSVPPWRSARPLTTRSPHHTARSTTHRSQSPRQCAGQREGRAADVGTCEGFDDSRHLRRPVRRRPRRSCGPPERRHPSYCGRSADGASSLAGYICPELLKLCGAKGFEPLPVPAKMGSELGRMFDHGVTRPLGVLPICAAVLRDVTVLWPVLQPVHPTGRAPW